MWDLLQEAEGGGRGAGGGTGTGGPRVRKHPPVWQLIKRNIYTHRARKQQDEDDIMICQCPRLWGPPDPKVTGCGPNCLNRMLNIECVTVGRLVGLCEMKCDGDCRGSLGLFGGFAQCV